MGCFQRGITGVCRKNAGRRSRWKSASDFCAEPNCGGLGPLHGMGTL